ncbi:GDSL-type esterase/lipase family protein [Stieleria varia]|uniref:GDSL-like Lipase/Acylhydrolase n=1 Tax=Stieleria varia TaxID=2528005 RepID=A0A5C6B2Z6_9BACT|nr:GDSL-type esterase/lipase family protein [Stieleria varia]TWU06260.1 GDSL-like Lipase/Acylhydrolase [Stieleria varia]
MIPYLGVFTMLFLCRGKLCVAALVGFAMLSFFTRFAVAQDKSAAVAEPAFVIPDTDDELPGAGPMRRAPWFRNVWQARRSTFAKNAEKEQNAVVFLGDSITQGWTDNFRGDFSDFKTANRGISGDTTRGMLWRLDEDVLSLDPSAVVMLMGTNDLEEGAEPETIVGNIELILKALKEQDSEMPIIWCNVFPSSEKKSRPADKIKKLNQLVGELVKGDKQITVLDTWTLFADENGDAKLEEFPDLLHPNGAGYDKWHAAIRPLFATLGFADTKTDDFKFESDARNLFNGTDLAGWCYHKTPEDQRKRMENARKNRPNAPTSPIIDEDIAFDGKKVSSDGRYAAINGRLVVTTPPEGRKIQQLWTTESFDDDFVLKLEFRATPNADSGVFIRGKQLQCRDYLLAGPYTELTQYKPQDWNELVIRVQGDTAHCTCNGEVLEAEFKVPESGPIGLEGDRGQIEYRRIRILPLQ